MERRSIIIAGAVIVFILGFALTCAASTKKISVGAYFYPEIATYRASFSMDITQEGDAVPVGWLKYSYSRTRMNVVSTGITAIEGSGKTATVSGTCTVNGVAGYTFETALTDASPDLFKIVIRKLNGVIYYSAGPKSIAGGDLVVSIPPISSLDVAILSPSNNAAVNTPMVSVKGTLVATTYDVGVSVNGLPASINGTNWAVDVPLNEGINTLMAKLTDGNGKTAQKSISVNLVPVPEVMSLSGYPESGLAPLQVTFSLSTSASPATASYQVDYEGDGIIDATFQNTDNISHIFLQEGIYYPTVIATDAHGVALKATGLVSVMNKTEIDSMLKEKWDEMKEGLKNKDIEKVLSYFIDQSKDKYRDSFELLKDFLPAIAQDMRDIKMVSVEDRIAEYEMLAIQDGVEYSFYIKFIEDFDGIWKIYFF